MSGITSWGDCVLELSNITNDGVQKALNNVAGLCGIALIIIGGLGAAGHLFMTGQVTGGCIVGLSITALILSVISTIRANNRIATALNLPAIINYIATAIIGSLTIAGVMSPFLAGVTVLSSSLVVLALNCCITCTITCGAFKETIKDPEKGKEMLNRIQQNQAQQVVYTMG